MESIIQKTILAIILCTSINNAFAEIIPDSRRIQWDPGVRGGIPTTFGTDCTASPLPTSTSSSSIQSALNTCVPACVGQPGCLPRVLKLASGTFNLSGAIYIPSYVVLRGAGMSQTILKGNASFSGDQVLTFGHGYDSE